MCEYDPVVRDFEELDEKLPMLAKIIVNRGIDFRQLEIEEPDPSVLLSIILIMRENLECMSDMTADEVGESLNTLNIACELVCLTNAGVLEKTGDKFICKAEAT